MELSECGRLREVSLALAVLDVKLRYEQTSLPVLWGVLQPLLAALGRAFVFGRVANRSGGGMQEPVGGE